MITDAIKHKDLEFWTIIFVLIGPTLMFLSIYTWVQYRRKNVREAKSTLLLLFFTMLVVLGYSIFVLMLKYSRQNEHNEKHGRVETLEEAIPKWLFRSYGASVFGGMVPL